MAAHKRLRHDVNLQAGVSLCEAPGAPTKRRYLCHPPQPTKRLTAPCNGGSSKRAPVYSPQAILVDQARLNEKRRHDEEIRRMEEERRTLEMEKQLYLRDLHYLQMAQARGGSYYPILIK